MQWQKRVYSHLSVENDVKRDGMFFFLTSSAYKLHMFTLNDVLYSEKDENVPLSFGIKQYLFGLSSVLLQ